MTVNLTATSSHPTLLCPLCLLVGPSFRTAIVFPIYIAPLLRIVSMFLCFRFNFAHEVVSQVNRNAATADTIVKPGLASGPG